MRHMSGIRRSVCFLCCAVLIAAGGSACTGIDGDPGQRDGSSGTPSTSVEPAPEPSVDEALEDRYQQVVRDVLPSVVQITTGEELGSGIVHDREGHIVTNAHVVGRSEKFEVELATGGQPLKAKLVAGHPEEDLAVIKLTDPPKRLRPAVFADSSKVEVGQIVLAMGTPLGLSSSVTQGIVSAVGRAVTEGEDQATLGNMVQTSAAINPGNSGGALVNLSGQVVGIPTLAARDPQLGGGAAPGIGFAIPAVTVRHLAAQMIEHGKVVDPRKASMGVAVRTILGEDFQPAGASVVRVAKNGPAGRAGIRPGDLIVQVDEEPVADTVSLAEVLATRQPDDRVRVTFVRADERERVNVRLGES
ncbi:trypsin-like peptidase domain-containing protein [Streptomyces sp. XM4193]|uniref:S1C family serine protease n=1 Tax=Streptomyces sp. XM4193 TaxID=2929782 RepID=UPI001FFA9935|nr:trypsin-like peptidase domain-containing protein [Streptomyces sp. XM4193]MCK1796285.1 trypsin-like peptidase domain-containing protein [Streptomyces sp. XM4193]